MIVVDANIVLPFVLDVPESQKVAKLHRLDPHWRLPRLWRHEVSSGLLKYVRAKSIDRTMADSALSKAIDALGAFEADVNVRHALDLALDRALSSYDAAYVALAQELDTVLVSMDKALAQKCAGMVVSLEEFLA